MAIPLIAAAIGLAAEFAPGLVRMLAGDNAGEVAEKVVGAAQALTGTSTPDEAATALRADPGLLLQYKKDMAAVELEAERLYLADRQDARGRDIELRKLAGGENRRADWMIAGDVAGLIVCVIAIFGLLAFKRDMQGFGELLVLLTTIANFFGLSLRDAHQFEFGSSRGSKEKDAIMAGRG